jgi:hypothetical protein
MKSYYYIIIFLLINLNVNAQFSQYLNVVINDTGSPEEPSIMMDPNHPDRLMAGTNLNDYYYSEDGGFTWTAGTLYSQYSVWGDPCLIVDTAGNFFYFHLSNPSNGNWIDRIVSQKFDFETHSWTQDTYTGLNDDKAQDKEWATVDSANNAIYVTWTQFDSYGSPYPYDSSNIMFSKSLDGGETWSDAVRINKTAGDCEDSDNTVEGAVPAVGPNGEIYVAWAGPLGIMFDRSADEGETWLDNDIFVSSQPGGWNYNIPGIWRCNGLPVTCCDLSNSPYRGTIYVNWTDQRNGLNDTDVWIAKSTDGGYTWTQPIRVNNDSPGKQQFFSWMAVDNANGDVYVVFYDRRNYDNNNTDVYVARSTDGGETFENIKVSESPFLPTSNVFFGDYTNITVFDGRVRPIWTRLNDGILSVLTAIVDISVGIDEPLQPKAPFVLEQNYPNPFKESTTIAFKVYEKNNISLKVCDVTGRVIAVLINNETRPKGRYIEHFSATKYGLKEGFYYFILQTGQFVKTQKVLIAN